MSNARAHLAPARLAVGDHVVLSGGYDVEPRWLKGQPSRSGVVVAFIPGQNSQPAAVVRLSAPMTVEGATGTIVVLELRYVGAAWDATETVHVELCDFMPERAPWKVRRRGKWVESHATYERVSDATAF